MQIEVERDLLCPALAVVTGVVDRRQTLPILSNLLVHADTETLEITATDLEMQITTRIDAYVIDAGAITLPARKFLDICRALPDKVDIKIQLEEERATVRSGRSRFVLSTLPAIDYPTIGMPDAEATLVLEQRLLKKLIEKTAFAMAQQDVRYYLNGLLLDITTGKMTAVATDGHRLAKLDVVLEELDDWKEPQQLIIPAKTVNELKRLLSSTTELVQIEFGQRALGLKFGDVIITTKLVDGRYPDYERVIPSDLECCAIVDREALRSALLRTAILSNEKYKGVKLSFDTNLLVLNSNNPEREEAEEEVEIDYSGEAVSIGFNISYLVDILNVIEGKKIKINFLDGNNSAIWQDADNEENEGAIYVIMPMRL
ncbi:DNA polymerase III subunit beta [Thiospirillum jenense]|uniref:Beta sliding clamp n=1 Tax=Thiospirillum jenense TaxID=1653858 RepID=A0A839HEF6_9GAMM|nr:DNA polymerase III subunit beta [Thiospirillum jenense]MBB1127041.1 DNA polymerase III subunit beta [Thiospirillum jenense]